MKLDLTNLLNEEKLKMNFRKYSFLKTSEWCVMRQHVKERKLFPYL